MPFDLDSVDQVRFDSPDVALFLQPSRYTTTSSLTEEQFDFGWLLGPGLLGTALCAPERHLRMLCDALLLNRLWRHLT